MTCDQCSTPMRLSEEFLFDHEPGDAPRIRGALERFTALGIRLGARVKLFVCDACDHGVATFDYDMDRP